MLQELNDRLTNKIAKDVPMSSCTSFQVGGKADYLVKPSGTDELKMIIDYVRTKQIPFFILGRGTNLLVRDGGIRGLVIKIGSGLNYIQTTGTEVKAGAGTPLPYLARKMAERGLSGLEFATGIPGTLGGGLVMNAGAFGGNLGELVKEVTLLSFNGELKKVKGADISFKYRWSSLREEEGVIVEAILLLKKDNSSSIRERMDNIIRERRKKQPNLPSAGSVFRNHPRDAAGRLIEETGAKGLRIGGASVSETHANFIVNSGGATATDILSVVSLVRQKVREKYNIELQLEIEVTGEDI